MGNHSFNITFNYLLRKMEKDKQAVQAESGEKKGAVRKFFSSLQFGRSPDTTEELELEIQELLEEGEEQGLISPLEEKMINSIFDFRDTLTGEIMTPAVEIVSADVAISPAEITALVLDNGFTRIPLFKGNSDRIVGVLHVKDLLKLCSVGTDNEDGQLNVEDCMHSPYFVSEKKPIVDLLKEFQKKKIHMAVVTDEFGAVRGLITLEDILEEIVGEIDDEFDVEEKHIITIDENTIIVEARTDVELVEERFDVELPEGPFESVGGLIIHLLGRIARKGDSVEVAGLGMVVKNASPRQIQSVQISRLHEPSA